MSDRQVRRGIEAIPRLGRLMPASCPKAVLPRRKEAITIRLDADLLEWLRRDKGYQTRINAVLRSCMQAHLNRNA